MVETTREPKKNVAVQRNTHFVLTSSPSALRNAFKIFTSAPAIAHPTEPQTLAFGALNVVAPVDSDIP